MKINLLILFLLITTRMTAFGQLGVKGTIIDDESGLPLEGVTIRTAGGSIQVKTDNDGNFSIRVPNTPDTLLVMHNLNLSLKP